jgi:hypothetical protein
MRPRVGEGGGDAFADLDGNGVVGGGAQILDVQPTDSQTTGDWVPLSLGGVAKRTRGAGEGKERGIVERDQNDAVSVPFVFFFLN